MLEKLKSQVLQELTGNILPFWINKAVDKEHGGYYGQINGYGEVVERAEKGGIVNARILWTFSAAYNHLKNQEYLKYATLSKDYILKHFFDIHHGGVYWKITFDGNPCDTKKQIYCQAFYIYALAEYYRATGDEQCLDKAISLFHLLENKSFDKELNGYFEAYSRDWKLLDDLRLSTKDANEKKTTNTHLHILEAYTNLYRVWKNKELADQLRNLVNIFLDKIIDPVSHHLLLFFDENWNSKSSLLSYGHDIEASWLIYEAAVALEDNVLKANTKLACIQLGIASLEGLQEDGSLIYEKDDAVGLLDTDRHWWPQAETLVGLINLNELTGDIKYLESAHKCWNYINDHLIDRIHGEWFWSIRNDVPNLSEDKVGFWKCPYHNARACLEVLKREKEPLLIELT